MSDSDSTPVLRVRSLRKEHGRGEGLVRAVDGVDLDVVRGETLAVMGPSGCGIVLSALSIAVTVSGIVAVLFAHATLMVSQFGESAGPANPDLLDVGFVSKTARENQVLLLVTIMLVALAVVNVIFITRATLQDSRHTSAVTRALGATPQQVSAGLSAAQIVPATAGAIAGIPGGFELFAVANQGGSASQPPAWWLIAVVLGTVIAVAGLTAIPARIGARRPVTEILHTETA